MLLAGAHEGTYDVDGSPIHYYHAGQRGTPIILIHGLGGSAEAWGFLLPRLNKKNTVYALDLPGFGRSPLAPEGIDGGHSGAAADQFKRLSDERREPGRHHCPLADLQGTAGHRLVLGSPERRTVNREFDGNGFVSTARTGDWVSIHWDWACQVLSLRQVANLERWTHYHLNIVNETL